MLTYLFAVKLKVPLMVVDVTELIFILPDVEINVTEEDVLVYSQMSVPVLPVTAKVPVPPLQGEIVRFIWGGPPTPPVTVDPEMPSVVLTDDATQIAALKAVPPAVAVIL